MKILLRKKLKIWWNNLLKKLNENSEQSLILDSFTNEFYILIHIQIAVWTFSKQFVLSLWPNGFLVWHGWTQKRLCQFFQICILKSIINMSYKYSFGVKGDPFLKPSFWHILLQNDFKPIVWIELNWLDL